MCSTSTPREEWRGRYYLGRSSFSVYETMARQLKQLKWVRCTQATRADLVLGDRFDIPYSSLRCETRLGGDSVFAGWRWVNYFQGSHKLTLKASMARLLRVVDTTHPRWMPASFVLGGDQSKRVDDREALLAAMKQEQHEEQEQQEQEKQEEEKRRRDRRGCGSSSPAVEPRVAVFDSSAVRLR